MYYAGYAHHEPEVVVTVDVRDGDYSHKHDNGAVLYVHERCISSLSIRLSDLAAVAQPPPTAEIDFDWALRELADGWISNNEREGEYGFYQNARRVLALIANDATERQREVDAKAICFMCAEPEKYQPPREVEGFDKPCHFYTASHRLRPNCNAAECKATAIRATKQT